MPDRDKIPYETSLSTLLLSVVRQAQADGLISRDEGELINKIQIDARDFESEIARAMKEGNTDFKEIFLKTKGKMIKNATEIAKKDGVISEDEEAIINKLIIELEKVEL
ncbi:MAG: hypothetical protein HeimC2_19910 [Candidatus Heimdallarchaeota archaeon LC_2]|nr:MAG: hypothetical protein HeimC2_19910 [Candidatus Heimdallarchaeota archaeon LC_2]